MINFVANITSISRKSILLLFGMTLLSLNSMSQSHPYAVKFSHQIENSLADGSIRPSRAGLLYSLIGKYQMANSYSDIPVSWGVDSLNLMSYELIDALPQIITEAQNHQILIISENHLKPQHRIFAKKIINELSKYGYKHLGMETLGNAHNDLHLQDTNLMIRGYPLDSSLTGTYTLESRMGQLVREALLHNYNLFGYERIEKIKGKDRDEIQADNVIEYLKLHPDEKVIILCGFHHAIESDLAKRGKYFWMAKYLKDKIGIDPLTIYQDNFTEKFIEDEHPVLSNISIRYPSIFINRNQEIVQLSDQVDMEIVHPKTIYKDGRPDWLYEDDDYRTVPVQKNSIEWDFPILASAYKKGEVNSVPVDRIEIKHKYDVSNLVLCSGTYRINISDGNTVFDYEVVLTKQKIDE